MNILTTIILIVTLLYALSSFLVLYGLVRCRPARVSQKPFVSVLIAARNEEERLPACLQSLLNSSYPGAEFEIIVIDDRSTDRTRLIAENFARQNHHVRVVPIHQRLDNLSGKASALCQGMEHARGEIILMTDADCRVPPNWMARMASYFAPGVGLVGGFTLLSDGDKKASAFVKIQTLDWIYLLTIGAGATGLGRPVSIIGNNFAFRRAAYEAVGGYQKIGFSIIEDFALMRAIDEQTDWQVVFPLDPQLVVTSEPAKTWREFYEQRQRWAAGGKEVGWLARSFMLAAFLGHLGCFVAACISISLAASCFFILTSADFLLLWQSTRRLVPRTAGKLLRIFPLFEIYYVLYSFFFAPTVLLPATVRWKGVSYRWNFRGNIKQVKEISR
ncbi:MAG: glycosyltransferase [candidate division KSB1 bacterium]|nr:glycosyltransferase [candidate division KSB1 bacterium]MDZ7366007.1 glycosyltransferase [candidate division KSB1 bacterium]MDZ7404124.1 glycosyltransferase [candidate division KSB1 bacterium]